MTERQLNTQLHKFHSRIAEQIRIGQINRCNASLLLKLRPEDQLEFESQAQEWKPRQLAEAIQKWRIDRATR